MALNNSSDKFRHQNLRSAIISSQKNSKSKLVSRNNFIPKIESKIVTSLFYKKKSSKRQPHINNEEGGRKR